MTEYSNQTLDEVAQEEYLKILKHEQKLQDNNWSSDYNERYQITHRLFQQESEQHGMSNDWTFKLDRAKERCGNCSYKSKTISLSRYFIQNNTRDVVLNTIRHEIAHALTPGAHHGKKWLEMALKIGCDGKTCCSVEAFSPPNWYLKCPCGKVNHPRHRRSRVSNKVCKTCRGSLNFIKV